MEKYCCRSIFIFFFILTHYNYYQKIYIYSPAQKTIVQAHAQFLKIQRKYFDNTQESSNLDLENKVRTDKAHTTQPRI